MKKINKARANKGDNPVFNKLRDPESRSYGRRPGSLLSLSGLKPGAQNKRHQALLARRQLPEQIRNHENSAGRLRGSEKAHKEARDRYKPQGSEGQPKKSFLSRLRDRKPAEAVPNPNEPKRGFSIRDTLRRPKKVREPGKVGEKGPKGRYFDRER